MPFMVPTASLDQTLNIYFWVETVTKSHEPPHCQGPKPQNPYSPATQNRVPVYIDSYKSFQ